MKITFKYINTALFLGIPLLFLSACGGEKNNTDRLLPKVEAIEFSATAMDILSIETIQFSALALYSDQSSRDVTSNVTWSVSNRESAIINTDGFLIPNGPGGDVNVTAGYGGYYRTETVTIRPLTVIMLSAEDENFTTNSTYQLSATGYFGDDNLTEDITSRVLWSTSDANISVVDINGLMYTFNVGEVDVNTTLFDINGSVELNITE